MRASLMMAALAVLLFAPGAYAQEWRSQQGAQSGTTQPPAGSYQGYENSRDIPQEQSAQVPDESRQKQADPGTLRRFNSNTGYGPEVQFETERREAAERARQQHDQQRQQGWR